MSTIKRNVVRGMMAGLLCVPFQVSTSSYFSEHVSLIAGVAAARQMNQSKLGSDSEAKKYFYTAMTGMIAHSLTKGLIDAMTDTSQKKTLDIDGSKEATKTLISVDGETKMTIGEFQGYIQDMSAFIEAIAGKGAGIPEGFKEKLVKNFADQCAIERWAEVNNVEDTATFQQWLKDEVTRQMSAAAGGEDVLPVDIDEMTANAMTQARPMILQSYYASTIGDESLEDSIQALNKDYGVAIDNELLSKDFSTSSKEQGFMPHYRTIVAEFFFGGFFLLFCQVLNQVIQ